MTEKYELEETLSTFFVEYKAAKLPAEMDLAMNRALASLTSVIKSEHKSGYLEGAKTNTAIREAVANQAKIDELKFAMKDYGLSEGVSYNSTPVVTYESIRKRIASLELIQGNKEKNG